MGDGSTTNDDETTKRTNINQQYRWEGGDIVYCSAVAVVVNSGDEEVVVEDFMITAE